MSKFTFFKRLILTVLFTAISVVSFAADRYWVGGTGNWSDVSHWSIASGGAGGSGSIPTSSDNVFFDANSFTGAGQSVSINVTANCLDMSWANASNNPTLNFASNSLNVYGDLILNSGMTLLDNGNLYLKATTTGNLISTFGCTISQQLFFDGIGGEWILQDSLKGGWANNLNILNGVLNTNSQPILFNSFQSSGSGNRTLILGSSIITCHHYAGPWDVYGTNLTIVPGSSTLILTGSTPTINCGNTSLNNVVFQSPTGYGTLAGSFTINHVIFNGYAYLNSPNSIINLMECNKDANFQSTGGATFRKAIFYDLANIQGNNIFDTIVLTSGKVYQLYDTYTQTINNLLDANGSCILPITLKAYGSGQATINSTTAVTNVNYTKLQQIKAQGGATFIANNSYDLGSNTGWTINTPPSQNLYWVGGTGSFNDAAHWSLTSGGAGGACVPTRMDNVFFDGASFNSGGQTVTINSNAECKNMDWTGVTNNPTLAGTSQLDIYGSLTLAAGVNRTFTGDVYFKANGATPTSATITMAGITLASPVYFDGDNSDWTLNDAFTTTGGVYLNKGYFVTNDKALNASFFYTNGSSNRGLYLMNSTITLSGIHPGNGRSWSVDGSNFSVDAGTSTIISSYAGSAYFSGLTADVYYDLVFSNAAGNFNLYYGAGYHNVTFNGIGTLNTGNATFSKVVFSKSATIGLTTSATIDTLQMLTGNTIGLSNTTTVKKIIVPGNCTNIVAFSSLSGQATINAVSPITVSYCTFKDINRTGSSFIANSSQDFGNNTGITINAAASLNLYWVGGTGNWNDPAHWSLTQGGAGGACVPTSADNVFFTTGSFTISSKTVTMNVEGFCKSMNWTNAPFSPSFTGTADLNIYGSLTFTTTINFSWTGKTYFRGTTTGNTIKSAGKSFANEVYFVGSGSYTLQDAFVTTNTLYVSNGVWNTNGYNVTCGLFRSDSNNPRTLNFGSSLITVTLANSGTEWYVAGSNFTINSGTSSIVFNSDVNHIEFAGGNSTTYYNVSFLSTVVSGTIGSAINARFNNVLFNNGAWIMGARFNKVTMMNGGTFGEDNIIDSLILTPGKTHTLQSLKTQYINRYLGANGTSGSPITINSGGATPAYISMTGCNVCCNYLSLYYISAVGGAQFYADNSTNTGGSTGWNFAACPASTLTVGPITGNANTCINSTNYTYSIPAVSGADSYVWTVPAGATILSGQGTNTIYVSFGSTGGNVSVDVSACGTTGNATKAITVNPLPTITNISTTPATCSNADGSATATVGGGTPTYYYRWSSGDTLATAPALTAGQYQLLVFDSYGCRATSNATIVASDGPQITLTSSTPPTCPMGTNGALAVSVTGGTTPYTILWSNGVSTLANAGISAGPYEVVVTDANECAASLSITLNQPNTFASNFTISPSACAGSTGSAQANITGGTGAYTYSWSANAASQTTQTASALAAGVYTVTVTDANACPYTAIATVPNAATTLTGSIGSVVAGDCGPNSAGTATMNASGGAGGYVYAWSNGATTADISGVAPGTYYCTVTDASLCSFSESVVIPSNVGSITQAICMVTVDTSTFTNQVIWEKTITNDIQSFKIYRESNITNVYTNIATVPFNNISEYTDPVANPAIHAWRYKITAVDSCGVETPYSPAHKTIHLAQNLGVGGEINLSWDQYEGFPYYSYYIWRHDPSTGWQPLDTLSTNYTTYTDFTPPSADSRYMIEVRPQSGCTSTLRLAGGQDINTVIVKSKSNIKNTRTTGIKSDILNSNLKVYPNPASDLINVAIEDLKGEAIITIENMLGQIVYTVKTTQQLNKINTSPIETGVYIVKVQSNNLTKYCKIIKSK